MYVALAAVPAAVRMDGAIRVLVNPNAYLRPSYVSNILFLTADLGAMPGPADRAQPVGRSGGVGKLKSRRSSYVAPGNMASETNEVSISAHLLVKAKSTPPLCE